MECRNEDDLLSVLEEGLKVRHTSSHEMNERSSRSHSLLTVYIEGTETTSDDGMVAFHVDSYLVLCDRCPFG